MWRWICTSGGQQTTLSVSPCLLHGLRQGILFHHSMLTGTRASGNSFGSTSCLTTEALRLQKNITVFGFYIGSRESVSGSHTCAERNLPTVPDSFVSTWHRYSHLGREILSWENDSISFAYRQICRKISWLTIDVHESSSLGTVSPPGRSFQTL